MTKFVFDLQRFADDSDGWSIDQALDVLNGTNEPATDQETVQEQPDSAEPETTTEPQEAEGKQPEQIEQQEEPITDEQPAIDYNLKVKFKANGVEQEKSIQDLINDAQLASNYNQKMQDLAAQRKAYEASLQQQQQAQPPDPAKQFEDLDIKVRVKAMAALGITDPNDFEPDSSGILGNKVHFAAYQRALWQVQQEEQSQQAQFNEYKAQEERYAAFINSSQNEPDAEKVNEHVINSFYALPQKGPEGIAEFNRLYPIYQKIQQRDEYWQGNKNVKIDPFTASELNEIEKFINNAKTEYRAKQTKDQVKAQVPKSVPIKTTVKVEGTGNGEPTPAKKLDMNKVRSMDLDDIAKLL